MTEQTTKEGKTLAVISYLTIIGVIVAYFTNKDKNNAFTLFHVKQSLGLWLSFFLLGYFVGYFNNISITFAFWIAIGILLIYGLIGALTGKENEVPFVGKLYQKIFKSL